jgi:hypothetical protein
MFQTQSHRLRASLGGLMITFSHKHNWAGLLLLVVNFPSQAHFGHDTLWEWIRLVAAILLWSLPRPLISGLERPRRGRSWMTLAPWTRSH